MSWITNFRDATLSEHKTMQGSPMHHGNSICVTCGKKMPRCWDTVCVDCGDTSCYECSFSTKEHWYCAKCAAKSPLKPKSHAANCPTCQKEPGTEIKPMAMLDAVLRPETEVRFIFAWYDFWVGFFWDRKGRRLYFFPIPCLGIVLESPKKSGNVTCEPS